MDRRRPDPDADAERVAIFDGLYDATFTQVLAYCRRRTRSLTDAEDAAAETFLVAWQKLDDATSAERPLLWLYSVAAKVTATQRRSQDRLRRLKERLVGLGGERNTTDTDDPVLTAADATQVVAALETLSGIDRELIRLVAYEQLTHAEAGMVVGMSETAVRTRVFRARRRLRRHLDAIRRDDPALPDTSIDEDPTRSPDEGRKEQP